MSAASKTAEILPLRPSSRPADTGVPDPQAPPSPLHAAIAAYLDARGGGEGFFTTPMDGVSIVRSFQHMMPMRQIYRPSLCVVVQGAKEMMFGDGTLEYGALECLVVSLEIPVSGRIIQASATEPFVGMTIELDTALIREVMQSLPAPPSPRETDGPCVFVGKVDAGLADAVVRLVNLAGAPDGIPVLYPLIMREIAFWLLTGPHGDEFCKLALPETRAAHISKAIHLLRDNFNKTLRIEQLSEVAGMSTSSFHQHFKTLTAMTPVQYQKQLRLLEARRVMVSDAASVAEAAYHVGYESASQFSREYSRMFGVAPKRDVLNYKALLETGLR